MRKLHKIILFIIICLLISTGIELYWSNYRFQVTNYQIASSRIESSFRVVQISDIHDSEFGKDNRDLIVAVREAEPDLILITGDLINSKQTIDADYVQNLISCLSQIAPVYLSFGNQEYEVQNQGMANLYTLYSEAGGIVLDSGYTDIQINNQTIRLGGIYGYCEPIAFAAESHRELESAFMENFQETDNFKILMCHMPYSWLESGSLYEWDVDAVFAGHVHGGQVRIPFIGGLWAPDQGWFPGRECGVYTTTEENWREHREALYDWAKTNGYDGSYYAEDRTYEPSYLILSRGLGNTDWVPRFNNIPEIVVVDFMPED